MTHVALSEPIIRSVLMEVRYKPTVTVHVDSVKIREGDDVSQVAVHITLTQSRLGRETM